MIRSQPPYDQIWKKEHAQTQLEFPANETLVGFGDCPVVDFEKVDYLFFIFKVVCDI